MGGMSFQEDDGGGGVPPFPQTSIPEAGRNRPRLREATLHVDAEGQWDVSKGPWDAAPLHISFSAPSCTLQPVPDTVLWKHNLVIRTVQCPHICFTEAISELTQIFYVKE